VLSSPNGTPGSIPQNGKVTEADEEIGMVEFVRVEYDLEGATDGVRESALPDEFADQLRAGGTQRPVKVP